MLATDLNSEETSIYEITSRRPRSQILIFFIFLRFISKKITFYLNSKPFRKYCDSQARTRWYSYR